MTEINVDFNQVIGRIKPMHGVGQPPFEGMDFSMVQYLADAGMPYARLHDVGGAYGRNVFVDIPNLFRDFSADETDPASYDFAFTDCLMKALADNGVEPFFRLGVTIENFPHIKRYRIDPPTDNAKWARICEGIINHYTNGWANGFHYKITYWEIWNEPDSSPDMEESLMWHGTKEQYFELYRTASCYLKEKFPHLKIGGYASCGFYALEDGKAVKEANVSPRLTYFIDFFEEFLQFVKENGCPFDFFSWHSYDSVQRNKLYAAYVREKLDTYGFSDTESICNEWNLELASRGTLHHAAHICAMMLMFQNSTLDAAMFYDARFGTSRYGGLFNPMTKQPFPAYYVFCAFHALYKLQNMTACTVSGVDGVYAAAAADVVHKAVLLCNLSGESRQVITNLSSGMCAVRVGESGLEDVPDFTPQAFNMQPDSILLLRMSRENAV